MWVWIQRVENDMNVFNDFQHLESSVRMTYSACRDVKIVATRPDEYEAVFKVTGFMPHETKGEASFEHDVVFRRYALYTEPSHL